MLVIVQIRSGSRVLKSWYGCSVVDQLQLYDLFSQYASGELDNSSAIPEEYATAAIDCSMGRSKTQDLTKVSTTLAVGEAVSALGQFIDFNVIIETPPAASSAINAATLLMESTSLPDRWNPVNSRSKFRKAWLGNICC